MESGTAKAVEILPLDQVKKAAAFQHVGQTILQLGSIRRAAIALQCDRQTIYNILHEHGLIENGRRLRSNHLIFKLEQAFQSSKVPRVT